MKWHEVLSLVPFFVCIVGTHLHLVMTCRYDYSALDTIAMVLQQFHKDSPEIWNYKWALAMIQHEVELTDRVCVPVSNPAQES